MSIQPMYREISQFNYPRMNPYSLQNILKVSVLFFSYLGSARGFPQDVMATCASNKFFTKTGKEFCFLDNVLEEMTPSACERLVSSVKKTLKEQGEEDYGLIKKGIDPFTKQPFDPEEGYWLRYLNGDPVVGVEVNPKRSENCKKTYKYLNEIVLNDPEFFQQSEERILGKIKLSHRKIGAHMSSDKTPGRFRKAILIVAAPDVGKDYESYQEELRKRGGTEEEVEGLMVTLLKVKDGISLSKGEAAAVKKLTPILLAPQEIPLAMKGFVKKFKEKMLYLQKNQYPRKAVIETAAWVHQGLIQIHPFGDGNGRLARLWMNAVLELGGIYSIYFPQEKAYIEATDQDLREKNGAFLECLEKRILADGNLEISIDPQMKIP